MKIAFQMDENINFKTDTTFVLIKEAQNRNHEVFVYIPNDLALRLSQSNQHLFKERKAYEITENCIRGPIALAKKVCVGDCSFISQKNVEINLNEVDIIFIRQDPPFNMRYITTTYILEKTSALVINNPTEIRNCPEKLLPLLFPELIPPTLITENISMIRDFYYKYKDIILKPLYSYGGNDVIRIQDEGSIQVVVELMIAKYECPIIAQLFCKNIGKDKRILLLDGKPIGIMKRIPRISREIRTNIRLGASFEPVEMSDRDHEICNKIGPELKKRGLTFVGIDIIDDFLLEINTTSPTGVVQINELYNTSLEKDLWHVFEKKVYQNKNSEL